MTAATLNHRQRRRVADLAGYFTALGFRVETTSDGAQIFEGEHAAGWLYLEEGALTLKTCNTHGARLWALAADFRAVRLGKGP